MDENVYSEDDEILYHKNLGDLNFDFEDYFERHKKKELSEAELIEFPARVYAFFCRTVYQDEPTPPWVAEYVADALFKGLMGVPWGEAMMLPWDENPENDLLNTIGHRAMSIYCNIENKKKADPSAKITNLLASQALELCVSYETVRADYYAIKKGIEKEEGIPERFLKFSSVF